MPYLKDETVLIIGVAAAIISRFLERTPNR
jgi:hypothetical protein